MRTIRVNLNGKDVEAFVVETICVKRRKKRTRRGIYEWIERHLDVYIPKHVTANKFLVIPIEA